MLWEPGGERAADRPPALITLTPKCRPVCVDPWDVTPCSESVCMADCNALRNLVLFLLNVILNHLFYPQYPSYVQPKRNLFRENIAPFMC